MVSSALFFFSLPLFVFGYSVGLLYPRQSFSFNGQNERQCIGAICIINLSPNTIQGVVCDSAVAVDSDFIQECLDLVGEAGDTLSAFLGTKFAPLVFADAPGTTGFQATYGSCQLDFVVDNHRLNAGGQIVTDTNSFETVLQDIVEATQRLLSLVGGLCSGVMGFLLGLP